MANKSIEDALQEEKLLFYRLIKSAAHELRTPLATINMASHATEKIMADVFNGYKVALAHKLIEPTVSDAKLQMIESSLTGIKKSAQDSQDFLSGLITYVENYALNPKDATILSITACLDKLLNGYPFNNDQERMLVHIDIKHEFMFKAPEIFINDLLAGLLKNALFYIEQAGNGDITIWTEKEKNWNILHFKDTGLGVKDERLSHVFDRLFSRRPDGTKAGLGFSKEALRQFGGIITCDSKEGEYTHFTIKFPVVE